MQVVEKSGEGLSRVYGVTVPAQELGERLEARIKEILPSLNLKGFRPGKAPPAHIRRIYGKALMGELVEKTLSEATQKVLEDHNLRIAARPDLTPSSDMEKVISGAEDLAWDLAVEVMPEFEPVDVATLKLTRLTYTPSDKEVAAALDELAVQNRTFTQRSGKAVKAREGDQVLVDFVGRIDGEAFDGGTANDAELVLGSGQFLPGFESQLVGGAPGKSVKVDVVFPDDYPVDRLKGKAAQFDVALKEVREAQAAGVDDALAERMGMKDLAALRDAVRGNLARQYDDASRFKLKRALLDALDERHEIALPPRMVENEFAGIWKQIEHDIEHGHPSPEDAGKSEETLRREYRKIAERRVRLGLVLAEIGRRAQVLVSDQEMSEAMRAEALRYGQQAQQIFEMLKQNPDAQTQIRAPLYEEKVVDLILSKAAVMDKAVSKERLLEDDELPASYAGDEPKAKRGGAAKRAKATPGPAAAEGATAKAATQGAKAAAKAPPAAAKTKTAAPSKKKEAPTKPAPKPKAAAAPKGEKA